VTTAKYVDALRASLSVVQEMRAIVVNSESIRIGAIVTLNGAGQREVDRLDRIIADGEAALVALGYAIVNSEAST
jgi:hypothetical protein